jgi:hypothetical protein
MLTIADIVTATCPNAAERTKWRSYLQRCLEDADVRDVCMGKQHPNYPEEALPIFHRIMQLRAMGYKPGGLAAQIRLGLSDPNIVKPISDQPAQPKTDQPEPGMDLTVHPQQAANFMRQLIEQIADQAGDRLTQKLLPAPEDRLIRAEEVAEMLSCGVGSIHQYLCRYGVDPVAFRPRRWRRSDILRLIQRL